MNGPIASAVVLPDPDDAPPASPNALKRRQSSATEDSVKRARTSDDAEKAPPKPRERGRERRLFGAVLGALSQNPTTAGQKRRSEIEQRQFAQRRQEDEESEQRRAERLARRKVQRWKETKQVERQAMRVRHDNMLHLAHFLCTKTEPRLYYKPWEMSPEEEDRIGEQIAEARDMIQRERDEFEEREEQDRRRERRATPGEETYRGTGVPPRDRRDDTGQTHSNTGGREDTNGEQSHPQDQEMQDEHVEEATHRAVEPPEPAMDTTSPDGNADEPTKDADEEIVEAAEDTVIY